MGSCALSSRKCPPPAPNNTPLAPRRSQLPDVASPWQSPCPGGFPSALPTPWSISPSLHSSRLLLGLGHLLPAIIMTLYYYYINIIIDIIPNNNINLTGLLWNYISSRAGRVVPRLLAIVIITTSYYFLSLRLAYFICIWESISGSV